MTAISNILQSTLLQGFAGSLLIALTLRILWRYFFAIWRLIKQITKPLHIRGLRGLWAGTWRVGLLALVIWACSGQIGDGLQYLEQVYWAPVYVYSDTSGVTSIYEIELSKHTTPEEYKIIRDGVYRIAGRVGSTPLALYSVMFRECGLQPFVFNINPKNGDTSACGLIQFTRAGICGLKINGEPAKFSQIKRMCVNRDAALMMDLCDQYMVSRANGVALNSASQIYTAIFAPGYVGRPESQVLYSFRDGESYTRNAGLDGHAIENVGGNQVIVKARKYVKGYITINDLALAIEYNKAYLYRNTFKN